MSAFLLLYGSKMIALPSLIRNQFLAGISLAVAVLGTMETSVGRELPMLAAPVDSFMEYYGKPEKISKDPTFGTTRVWRRGMFTVTHIELKEGGATSAS